MFSTMYTFPTNTSKTSKTERGIRCPAKNVFMRTYEKHLHITHLHTYESVIKMPATSPYFTENETENVWLPYLDQ